MSDALIATGIMIQAGDGASPEVFADVAELVSLTPPPYSRNEIEVPTHNAGRDDKILGMFRRGQVTAMINWVPNDLTHQAILADIKANTKRNWRIRYPGGTPTWTFPARVQNFAIAEATTDSALQAELAWTIDGDVVEA